MYNTKMLEKKNIKRRNEISNILLTMKFKN